MTMMCFMCKDTEFGTGPLDWHDSQEVHRGNTCEEIEAMEW